VRSLYVGERREPVDQLGVSGISAGLVQDLRIDVRETGTADARLTVRFVPVAAWIWIAGCVGVLAALVAALAPSAVASAVSAAAAATDSAAAPPHDPERA
jgi:hypothetical protein